ncbi:MAG: OsmC/Ohr family protein [uncultured Thiotrichaceae bacterium]|uniref:OsmC/Ohr family protein n=1 Tax=uncultured Thiotrichaceae bacterium TaxID=298394 RepID=A0A6S6T2Q6_9GAMM|nr:MAG: OsmC/Ohr family protein [uncultured Thiotrichaceae bacterium]
MQARVKWLDNMSFVGESGSGHSIVMDASPEVGGRDLGVRPMEMLLLGLGGCASIDVVMILQRSRQDIKDCTVQISAEREDTEPKVFTKIHLHFVVEGNNLSADRVKRAISLSAEKYCSASLMLGKTAAITHDFEVSEVTGS